MTGLNPGWLLGAVVNLGLIVGYITVLWAGFAATDRILGHIDRWRRR